MKNLIDILEAKINPDSLYKAKKGEDWHFARKFTAKFDGIARPFVINSDTKKIVMGDINETHEHLITELVKKNKLQSELGVESRFWKREYDNFDKKDPLWLQGRVFDFGYDDKIAEEYGDDLYIVFWCEMSESLFYEAMTIAINRYEEIVNKMFDSFLAVDNNGEPFKIDFEDDTAKLDDRNDISKLDAQIARALHAGTTAELRELKRKLNASYIKSRDAHFQRDYYDKTKSKTAAEWHNNKTKRYNPHTGKMEWGEKIGDSLVMKNLKDYIYESKTITLTLKEIVSEFINGKIDEQSVINSDIEAYVQFKSIKNTEDYVEFINKNLNEKISLIETFNNSTQTYSYTGKIKNIDINI